MVFGLRFSHKHLLIIFFLFSQCFYTDISARSYSNVTLHWQANNELDLAGYKVYYGTVSREYDTVIDVGVNTFCRIGNLSEGIRYYFAVTAYDLAGNESDFSEQVSTIIPNSDSSQDTTPPEIDSVRILNETTLHVIFTEAVERTSAENEDNYQISEGVEVNEAILSTDALSVILSTTEHTLGQEYTLFVINVRDQAEPPNIVVPNYTFTYFFGERQGKIQYKGVYNYPNPFNPDQESTITRYYLNHLERAAIQIYDSKGDLVRTLLEATQKGEGEHTEDTWDGTNESGCTVGNGVYFGKVTIGSQRYVIKIAVVR